MYHPRGSLLQTASKKIKCEFVGPLAIYKCVSPNQFLLMSLDVYLYTFLVEETRIKTRVYTHYQRQCESLGRAEESYKT